MAMNESIWEKILFGSTCAVMLCSSLMMNILVCYVTYRSRQLRLQFSSVFIVNLAVCDILKAILSMPFTFGAVITGQWLFGSVLCQLSGFANLSLAISTILTLVVISIDRYYAVVKPLKYRAKMTISRALCSISLVWTQALSFALVPIIQAWYTFNQHYFTCTFPSQVTDKTKRIFLVTMYAINFVMPLAVMLFTYYRIFRIARRHCLRVGPAVCHMANMGFMAQVNFANRQIGRQREAKAARKIFFVVAAFFGCTAPYSILRLLELNGSVGDIPFLLTISASWLNLLKSTLNPLIYGIHQRRFRVAFFSMFCARKNAKKRFPTHFEKTRNVATKEETAV